MKSWGVTCLVLGVGSFILPMIGLQFAVLSVFGDKQPLAAIALAVVGAVLVMKSLKTAQ